MTNLKEIVEKIKNKDLVEALKLCDDYNDKNNQHIISNFKGVIHLIKGNLELSEKNLLKSIELKPQFEDPIKNLYSLNLKKKKFDKVLFYAKKLVELNSFNNEYNYQLAYAHELNNNLNETIENYLKYISLDGKNKKQAYNNIGCLYLQRNNPKTAKDYFLKGIEFGEDKIIINNLFRSYILLRDTINSDILFRKAENIDKNFLEFKYNKAKYLILKNEIENAIKILKDNINNSQFLITLLILYSNIGRKEDCNKLLTESKDRIINEPEFLNYYGLKLLYEGNFKDGWKYYEYRNSKITDFFKGISEWSGEEIKDKTIVVFNEQGIGDSIQFSKYIIPLTKIAQNVTFAVQTNIQNIFSKEIPNLSIETINDCKNKKFDFKIALGSLIKFFFEENFNKNENLLQTNKNNDLKWNKKINTDKLNVGIVWSGGFNGANEPYRSIPLKSLRKIFLLKANFYCLQNEIWDRDRDDFNSLDLIDCGKYKLDEISSIIKNLDLVITSDTSILHLSASLNKETWGMLALHPDWRWGEFNKINPYSNLTIYNQLSFNDWSNVENQIYSDLEKKIINRKN
ncbi:glycosyltransferase family 9 protein [Candidatus Pelagibacter sp.]|uniref:glycosyltransferase family 9 protein n=1 Tax=Candidatus Pelagibacter sp. TaxID=2024849 RepID=UPI003F82781D